MRRHLITCILSSLAVSGPIAADSDPRGVDVLAKAAEAGQFEALVRVVTAAGLEDVLRGDGPFTVLAPTDSAFDALPERTVAALLAPVNRDALVKVLRGHIVSGEVSAVEALAVGSVPTLAGPRLDVDLADGRLRVGGALVVGNDIRAENGVIHAIDRVIVPDDLELVAPPAPAPTSAQLIEVAIDRGVQLFNNGDHAACVAVYELCALSLLSHTEPALADSTRGTLSRVAMDRENSVTDRAWFLRHALDSAYEELSGPTRGLTPTRRAAATEATPEPAAPRQPIDLIADESTWRVINDTVMGGRSSSRTEKDGIDNLVFRGNVSLENNGGFASARRNVERGSFEGFDGLTMVVRGDGKRYRVQVSDKAGVSADVYRAEFETVAGQWIEVRVPFAEMERNVMGFRPPNSPPIRPDRIRAVGVSIGDKQNGKFRLEIREMTTFAGGTGN